MNRFVTLLQSKSGAAIATLLLMAFYVPDAAYLFLKFTHLPLTTEGAWVFYLLKAYSLEIVILVCIINQWKWTGRIYSACTFVILLYYYDQFEHGAELFITIILSFFHSLSIWNLTEIFNEKIEAEKVKDEQLAEVISMTNEAIEELQAERIKSEAYLQDKNKLEQRLAEAELKLTRKRTNK